MLPHRLLGIFGAIGLTAALGFVAAAPADARGHDPSAVADQHQSLDFTSTAPSGEDWITGLNCCFPQYVASATASSGLPVEYSIAPESAHVCWIRQIYTDDPLFGSGAGINFMGAGTCTVLADQPGNDQYLPAPQAVQSFQVEKVQTFMDRVRGKQGLPGHPAWFTARLETWDFIASNWLSVVPFIGQPVTFKVAGRPVCTGTTDSNGIATCRGALLDSELPTKRFIAVYPGNRDYARTYKSALFTVR